MNYSPILWWYASGNQKYGPYTQTQLQRTGPQRRYPAGRPGLASGARQLGSGPFHRGPCHLPAASDAATGTGSRRTRRGANAFRVRGFISRFCRRQLCFLCPAGPFPTVLAASFSRNWAAFFLGACSGWPTARCIFIAAWSLPGDARDGYRADPCACRLLVPGSCMLRPVQHVAGPFWQQAVQGARTTQDPPDHRHRLIRNRLRCNSRARAAPAWFRSRGDRHRRRHPCWPACWSPSSWPSTPKASA